MSEYFSVEKESDIDAFIKQTNALHDGYIMSVEYHHNGILKIPCGHAFYPEWTELKICVLITSICDAVLEMVFENIVEWKIKESQSDILNATVQFDPNGFLIWTDDDGNIDRFRENDAYVIAKRMKWRIL